MIFNTPAPEDIVRWYRKGVPGGGQKDRIFDRLKAKLTGGTDDSGTSYFSMLEKKISTQDADIIIKNMKTDIDGYPMLETGSTSGQDERRYQEWIVERYLKTSFTEGFTDTTVAEEKKEDVAEEEAEEIVEKAEEEVKENIDEAVKAVDEVVVDKPVVEETAPDLSDIVDLLPPGMLDAVNQQTGQNYEKTPKEKKQKVGAISNVKILKTLTSSLEKIQGQLSSIDNELKKQNELFGAAVGTTVSNLNQIETTYDSLNDRFDDILNAMQSQNETEKEEAEAAETAASEANMEGQEDVADTFGYEDTTDPMKKKGGGGPNFLKFLRFLRFLRTGGIGKMLRRMRNPLKTGRALLRKGRMGLGNKLRKIPGARRLSSGLQRSTNNLLRGGSGRVAQSLGIKASKIGASKAAAKAGSRFIPGVGTALGVGFAIERFAKGDIVGGLLASGGAIPGPVGWAFLAAELGLIPLAEARMSHLEKDKEKKYATMKLETGGDLTPEEQEAVMYGEQRSTPEELEAKAEYTKQIAAREIEPLTPQIKQYTPSFIEKITPGGTFFGKFEQGGSGTGVPELHGTEALIEPGFYKDLMRPIGGTILAASSKVLSDVGPLAATVAPSFQQEASKIATAFDVPKSLASTNVGGSIDGVANSLNKISRKTEEENPLFREETVQLTEKEKKDLEEADEGSGNFFSNIARFFGIKPKGPDGKPVKPSPAVDSKLTSTGSINDRPWNTGIKLTNLTTKDGQSFKVASVVANQFKGFVADLEATGYKIKTIGGFRNAGTGGGAGPDDPDYDQNRYSHPYGASIDINANENPYDSTGNNLVTDMPDNIGEIAAKHGLGWGGAWNSVKDAMHFSAMKNEGGNRDFDLFEKGGPAYATGGVAGMSGQEQITVGEEGPEIVMKNLVYGVPPVLDHLLAMNDAGTPSELIQTYRTFVPEVLEYDEEAESMAQTIIVMSPPQAQPEPTVDVPRDRSITRPPMGVAPGKAAMHIALFN